MIPLDDPFAFARAWVDAWNRRDLDAVLALFAEDCRFSSPKAAVMVGTPVVEGKDALRRYWQQALDQIGHLHFELHDALADPTSGALAIFYIADLGGRRTYSCERLTFGADGLIHSGGGYYGAPAV